MRHLIRSATRYLMQNPQPWRSSSSWKAWACILLAAPSRPPRSEDLWSPAPRSRWQWARGVRSPQRGGMCPRIPGPPSGWGRSRSRRGSSTSWQPQQSLHQFLCIWVGKSPSWRSTERYPYLENRRSCIGQGRPLRETQTGLDTRSQTMSCAPLGTCPLCYPRKWGRLLGGTETKQQQRNPSANWTT